VEELRNGKDEVEDLWHEEEKHRLAEVTEDSDDGERHASKVAKCVADKHSSWIPDSSDTMHCMQLLCVVRKYHSKVNKKHTHKYYNYSNINTLHELQSLL